MKSVKNFAKKNVLKSAEFAARESHANPSLWWRPLLCCWPPSLTIFLIVIIVITIVIFNVITIFIIIVIIIIIIVIIIINIISLNIINIDNHSLTYCAGHTAASATSLLLIILHDS